MALTIDLTHEWEKTLLDQVKSAQSSSLTIDERLQLIRETTQAARETLTDISYKGNWNRENIYEGDTERILGIKPITVAPV